ncbi:MAG: hypothetical protein NC131_08875 [Roseburia sp.]|nr:hypothetical protein [Roseburia sp.]
MKEPYVAAQKDDKELVDVLTAISVVSMRLARKLTMLESQSQRKEGGKSHGKNQRTGYGYQRSAKCGCRH